MKGSILVTGAASGIGRAAAVALAREGFSLGLLDTDLVRLREVKRCCGAVCRIAPCDVTEAAQVTQALGEISKAVGRPEIVVNSAGVARYGSFQELPAEEWRRQYEVNLMGSVNIANAVLAHMLARKSGLIINIGSRRGLDPDHRTSAYSASKAALLAMTRSFNAEYRARGVAMTYLAPGGTMTNLATPKDPRFMSAETVAQAIVFVCSVYPAAWVSQLELLPPAF